MATATHPADAAQPEDFSAALGMTGAGAHVSLRLIAATLPPIRTMVVTKNRTTRHGKNERQDDASASGGAPCPPG